MNYRPTGTKAPASKKSPKPSWKKHIKPVLYACIFLIVVYALTISSLLRIKKIEIVGLQTLNEDSVREQIQVIVGSSAISQNILFVPMGEINSQLKKDNYQIAKAEVSRIPFNTIKVTVTEQKPSILWQSDTTLSILTEDGRAYAGEPNNELKQTLPIVIDSTNLPVRAGEKIVSESFVKFVNKLHTQLPQKGVKATTYQVEQSTTEIFVTTDSGYKIRFDTSRSIEDQLIDLVTVLDLLKKQGKKPLEYIDLRINSKAFYK